MSRPVCACGCGERASRMGVSFIAGHRPPRPIAARLWARVAIDDADKCWEWQGYRAARGHGQIGAGRKGAGQRPVHQVAWEFFNGRAVADGMQVNHHCDNPPCCNPRHLYEGTQRENVDDMQSRGRMAVGQMLPHAKLTRADVQEIRRIWETRSMKQREIAAQFGISQPHVSGVVNGKEWTW